MLKANANFLSWMSQHLCLACLVMILVCCKCLVAQLLFWFSVNSIAARHWSSKYYCVLVTACYSIKLILHAGECVVELNCPVDNTINLYLEFYYLLTLKVADLSHESVICFHECNQSVQTLNFQVLLQHLLFYSQKTKVNNLAYCRVTHWNFTSFIGNLGSTPVSELTFIIIVILDYAAIL